MVQVPLILVANTFDQRDIELQQRSTLNMTDLNTAQKRKDKFKLDCIRQFASPKDDFAEKMMGNFNYTQESQEVLMIQGIHVVRK